MPHFTVSEDGGEAKDWDYQLLQQHFESFMAALVRGLAAGAGAHRLTQEFFRFLEHAQKTEVPIGPVLDGAVTSLHEQAFSMEGQDDFRATQRRILHAALCVIAESMASDIAAYVRFSRRMVGLTLATEEKMLGSEHLSRENRWIYLAELKERLGAWPERKK